jgi:hypothetical protein
MPVRPNLLARRLKLLCKMIDKSSYFGPDDGLCLRTDQRIGKEVPCSDNGFCVTAGVTVLHAHGVFRQFLIKKRRYWPVKVPGDQINAHMSRKELGEVKSLVLDLGAFRFSFIAARTINT